MRKSISSSREPLALVAVFTISTACGESPSQPEPAFPVVEATIADIQAAVRDGRTSCRAVVESYLARIDTFDASKRLNAISMLNPRALERADETDRSLAAGEPLGQLFCVPILVKDNFDTHDLPTTAGSIALKDSLPPDDAFMVRKLREAGAIVLAKTNMAEWAFSPKRTESSSVGITANAYALDRVPAGSSGGTASGVAASFGVAGLGSDTGNSIRGPSSHLALFGIRSTLGLTSRDGVIPLYSDRDIAGPMTRTVEDGARLFDVVAGYDPADPVTELGRHRREEDYTAFLDPKGLANARLAVLMPLVLTEDADPEVTALFERAVSDLRGAGAEVVADLKIPRLDAHLEKTWGDYACGSFRYDVYQYMKSLGNKAPFLDVTSLLETGQHAEYVTSTLERAAGTPLDVPPSERDEPCPFYLDHPGRKAYRDDVIAAMDEAQIDALIYPTWTHPPAHLDKPEEEYRGDNSQLVAPATGLPAVTVPMGFSYNTLPAGLQMLGRPYSEGVLIRLAYAYEQATKHRRAPSAFPELPR